MDRLDKIDGLWPFSKVLSRLLPAIAVIAMLQTKAVFRPYYRQLLTFVYVLAFAMVHAQPESLPFVLILGISITLHQYHILPITTHNTLWRAPVMKKNRLGFRRRPEAGEAEMGLFIIVVIVCGLVSGSLFILNWIKDAKDAKVLARMQDRKDLIALRKARPSREPGAYFTHCQKPLWSAFSSKAPCDVLDESYVETELENFRPEFR